MSSSEGVQKRNAFATFAAFRLEGLEASLNHAREIAARESWTPWDTTSRKRKDTWRKSASCMKKRWMSSAGRRENRLFR